MLPAHLRLLEYTLSTVVFVEIDHVGAFYQVIPNALEEVAQYPYRLTCAAGRVNKGDCAGSNHAWYHVSLFGKALFHLFDAVIDCRVHEF